MPGGVLLATLPCVSRVDYESGLGPTSGASRLRRRGASSRNISGRPTSRSRRTGTSWPAPRSSRGSRQPSLSPAELDERDPYFPLLVAVRAVKPGTRRARLRLGRWRDGTTGDVRVGLRLGVGSDAPEQRLRLDVWKGSGCSARRPPTVSGPTSRRRARAMVVLPSSSRPAKISIAPARRDPGDARGRRRELTGSPRRSSASAGGTPPRHSLAPRSTSAAGRCAPVPMARHRRVGGRSDSSGRGRRAGSLGRGLSAKPVGLPRPDLADAFPDAP